MAYTSCLAVFLLAVALFGCCAGLIDVSGHLRAARYAGRSEVLVIDGAFSIGAVLGPLAIAVFGYQAHMGVREANVAYIIAATLMVFSATRGPEPIGEPTLSSSHTRTDWRGVLLVAAVAGAEFTIGQWIASFLREKTEATTGYGAVAVSVFWSAAALARFAISRIRVPDVPVLVVGTLTLAGGALALVSGAIPALAAVGICGLGIGPVYPLVIAERALRVAPARGVARLITAATVGSAGLPFAIGLTWSHYAEETLAIVAALPAVIVFSTRFRWRA
jgi:hypothetical protein